MDPTQLISGLLTLPFAVLIVMIGLLTSGFRWVIENLAKVVAKYFADKYEPWWIWFWKEAILPITPLVIGGLIGTFISQYPYPEPFAADFWARVFISIIAGLIASWSYPRIMYYVRNYLKKTLATEEPAVDSTEEEPKE